MALRGNLRDFSLPDVFQLVTFSRKTGVLRIVREDGAQGSVWFREGDVFFASSNWHSEPLGERLVRAQRITAQALSRALELRRAEPAGGRRLGQILIDDGYITSDILEAFVSEQVQDTIFDLMRWEEGEFDFEAMPEAVEEDIGLTVSIENIVMEGSRRLEEWGRIRKKIPSVDIVFKMATAPGEGTFEISLKPVEWRLLLLIDGTRSVADLAVETSRTDFEIARILYGLFSAGLLEFATEDEIAHNRAEREEREAKLALVEQERRVAEEAQVREALAREQQLVEGARERQQAEAVAKPTVVETLVEIGPAVGAVADEGPSEVPEFLGAAPMESALDDQAVLDEFMGAILEQPQPVAPSPPVAETPEPHVPVEEPAFFAPDVAEHSGEPAAVASAEELFGELTGGSVELEVPLALAPEPAPEIDFESELLGLGLGELPADLLEPITAEPEPEVVVEIQPEPEPEVVVEIQQEPVVLIEDLPSVVPEPTLRPSIPDQPVEFVAEPMSMLAPEETAPFVAEPAPASVEAADISIPPQAPPTPEPDFSLLLESLDVDAEEEVVSPAEAGFDVDLLIEDEVEVGGVISTDAYLGDIGINDLGFSGGLTDELSALTGADRRQAPRPQANVHAIPDADGSMLHRDARVDKDTVLKIIDGIKNL